MNIDTMLLKTFSFFFFNVIFIFIHSIVFSIVKFAMSKSIWQYIGFILLKRINQLILFFFYFTADYLSKDS